MTLLTQAHFIYYRNSHTPGRCMQLLIVLVKFNIKFKTWRTNKDMGASQHGLF